MSDRDSSLSVSSETNVAVSSPSGLIHALLLDGKGGARALTWPEVVSWQQHQGALWLHFDYTDEQARAWIENESGLNHISVEGLLCDETRPHILSRGDNLLCVLRGVNLNPGSNPEDMVSLRLWTDGKRLISTRKRALLSTQDLVDSLAENDGPKDIQSLLVTWIERLVWRMSDTVDGFEDDLLALEESLFDNQPKDVRQGLMLLRKQTLGIRRYLAPQREAINRLISVPLSWMDELHVLHLRGVADRQIRHIEDIDAVRERAAMAQEELVNTISEQANSRTYVLTIVAAIFLPLGFFTGLLGINVGGVPGVENDAAFWIVSGACLAVTLGLAGLFYWRRWL